MSRLIRVLSLLFSLAVVTIVIVLIMTGIFKDPSMDIPMVDEPVTRLNFQIKGYNVYDYSDIPFKFIIADAYILDSKNINYSLKNLVTEENVSLDNVQEYIWYLNKSGYQLRDFNYSSVIKSTDNQAYLHIFIPVLDNNLNIMRLNIWDPIINSYNYYYFDLKQNVNSNSMTDVVVKKLNTDLDVKSDVIEFNKDLVNSILVDKLKVFNSEQIFYYNPNKSKVKFDDNVKIYSLELFHDYKQSIIIKAMKLVFSDGYSVFALPGQYHSTDNDNIIGRIWESGNGRAFFEVDLDNINRLNSDFKLYVLFKGMKEWIKIK